MQVAKISEPTVVKNHMVWVVKGEDDDWGELPDGSYRDRRIKPNVVCVIVAQNDNQFSTTFMQAREQDLSQGEMINGFWCRGTSDLKDRLGGWYTEWAYEVAWMAEDAVKERVRRLDEDEPDH